MNILRYLRTVLLLLISAAPWLIAQPTPYQAVNTPDDDYAAAFRYVQGKSELWYTTSNGFVQKRSRRLMRTRMEGGAVPSQRSCFHIR